MFGVSIRQQRATAVGNATDEWTTAPAWSAISESTLEPRCIPTPLQFHGWYNQVSILIEKMENVILSIVKAWMSPY